jgi:mannose-6-phosphate isomerase-like protein (cupin superfamily)
MSERDRFELSDVVIGLTPNGEISVLEQPPGPPPNVDGHLIGVAHMTRPPPHGGERHDDGDEPLLLLSGAVDVVLEEEGRERRVELRGGQGFVVPRGVWHRLLIREPSTLVFVTPGPHNAHRPLRRSS